MSEYRPVTVEAAKRIADEFEKDAVVIVALDRAHDVVHTTTFGRKASDKEGAAEVGDKVAAMFGPLRIRFEDFRDDAAKLKEDNDRLRKLVESLSDRVEKQGQLLSKRAEKDA